MPRRQQTHKKYTARICIASRRHSAPRCIRTRPTRPHHSRNDLVRAGARSPAARFGARGIVPPPNAVHGWHGSTIKRGTGKFNRRKRVHEAHSSGTPALSFPVPWISQQSKLLLQRLTLPHANFETGYVFFGNGRQLSWRGTYSEAASRIQPFKESIPIAQTRAAPCKPIPGSFEAIFLCTKDGARGAMCVPKPVGKGLCSSISIGKSASLTPPHLSSTRRLMARKIVFRFSVLRAFVEGACFGGGVTSL